MRCGWTRKVAGSTPLNSYTCILLNLRLVIAQDVKISAAKESDTSSFHQDASCLPFILWSVRATILSATRRAPALRPTSYFKGAGATWDEGVGGMVQMISSRAPRPAGLRLSKHATLKGNLGPFHVWRDAPVPFSREWRKVGWEKLRLTGLMWWSVARREGELLVWEPFGKGWRQTGVFLTSFIADCHFLSWHTQDNTPTLLIHIHSALWW